MTNRMEKMRELASTINNLEKMLLLSKQEMKSLEVEWLHLRGLVKTNSENVNQEPDTDKTQKHNFDDANKINSEKFDFDITQGSSGYSKPRLSNYSENDSSEDDE